MIQGAYMKKKKIAFCITFPILIRSAHSVDCIDQVWLTTLDLNAQLFYGKIHTLLKYFSFYRRCFKGEWPIPHTQKKKKRWRRTKGKKKFYWISLFDASSKWIWKICFEYFPPPCKTFDYIVSPSTVNVLKLLLLGDEMQMMVHCSSDISVCCILFIHLAQIFIFVSHSTQGSVKQLFPT